MRNLLKAMGFWVWGLLAVALAASVANVGYRWALHYRSFLQATRAQADALDRLTASESMTGNPPNFPARAPETSLKSAADISPEPARIRLARNQDLWRQEEEAKRLLLAGGLSPEDAVSLRAKVMQSGGCSGAFAWADAAINRETAGGKRVPLEVYELRSQCAVSVDGHTLPIADVDRDIVRSTGSHWRGYLYELIQSQGVASEFTLYRLLYLTGSQHPEDEEIYAANLYSRGYYAEAAAAYARARNYAASAGETVALDFAGGAASENSATQAAEVNATFAVEPLAPGAAARLATICYEFSDYARAERLFESMAEDLPGLGNADDYYVTWALSLMALHRDTEAAAVLKRMLTVADMRPRVADAWRVYVELYLN